MFCPHCGDPLQRLTSHPLYACPLCGDTYTNAGVPCSVTDLQRYLDAAKLLPPPRQAQFSDISAQPTVKLRHVTPAYTDAQQEIMHLQELGFTDDQLQTFCGLRMAYPALAG